MLYPSRGPLSLSFSWVCIFSKATAERNVQPMVIDISDGPLEKIVLNCSGPFMDTGPSLGTTQ